MLGKIMRQATDYIKLTCHYGLVCRSRLYTILSNSLLTCEELKGSYKKSVYPSPVSVIVSSIKMENIYHDLSDIREQTIVVCVITN